MERKLGGGGIGGGGREERCRGCKTSAKGQHGNRCIGSVLGARTPRKDSQGKVTLP